MFFRNCLFGAVFVAAFFTGLEAILAAAGVHPVISTEDPFVGFAGSIPLFVEAPGAAGNGMLRTAENKLHLFNPQTFPKQKDDGSYRIFCMGGSTTFGRPYDDRVSFCGWLRAYLDAADPGRHWEVINAGGVSYASYRVANLMQELSQYSPDLFIVYSGQNEFLEQRSYGALIDLPSWMLELNAKLSGTRIYTAMSRMLVDQRKTSIGRADEQYSLSGEVDTILDHTIGPQSYHRDDQLKQRIMTHYRLNLERMVQIARQSGAGILFIRPAVNIRDMSPFKSEHAQDLPEKARQQWAALYRQARSLDDAGTEREALKIYREALAIDDRYAELHYSIGSVLFRLGEYDAAELAFRRAVDEDVAPLRILQPMQQDVERVAASAGVPLVDFPAVLRSAYRESFGHTVFGGEYFVDHVHTNVEGYRLLGLALFDELAAQGIVHPAAAWGAPQQEAVRQQVMAQLDVTDEGHALVKLGRIFAWAGKFAESYRLFRRALQLMGPDPSIYDQLARSAYAAGEDEEAISALHELLGNYPAIRGAYAKLAGIHANRGEPELAIQYCQLELVNFPANPVVRSVLAALYEQQGDEELARQQYEHSLQLSPDQPDIAVRLAQLLVRLGEDDAALQHALAALENNRDDYRVHEMLGRIFMRRSEVNQAVHHFSEVLRLSPDNTAAIENLRRLHADRQQKELTARL